MKILRIIVFVLAMLVLLTQAARHVYVQYLEPRTSVLDKFEKTEAKKIIQSAMAISDLLVKYEPARKRVDQLDEKMKQELPEKTRDEYYMLEQKWKEDHKEEYELEEELKVAIQDWEERSKEILELRVFWLFGFLFFLAGIFMIKKGLDWFGVAFIVPGIVEMIWWTSPSFRFAGSPLEFDRLLNNKLAFTVVTLIILIVAWYLSESKREKNLYSPDICSRDSTLGMRLMRLDGREGSSKLWGTGESPCLWMTRSSQTCRTEWALKDISG